jgi:hypothetical protein
VVDEQLKRVFDDYQENNEQPDLYENRNVDGWSFVQPGGAPGTQTQGGLANAGNHQIL